MGYAAKIVKDSVSEDGHRLTTFEVAFPRIVLAEFNTHRVFSRNSASSRAIPIQKQIKKVMDDPFVPTYWGKNQSGMQANEELTGESLNVAIDAWLDARDKALEQVAVLRMVDAHKQLTNRLLEPWMWQTVIVTATEWSNFFALRANPQAQPEIRTIAEMMLELYNSNEPELLTYESTDYHLPYISDEDFEGYGCGIDFDAREISAARCARVSYLTHDGKRDLQADKDLFDRLTVSGHLSPLEHVAFPEPGWHGNFNGWKQLRKLVPNEDDFSKVEK